MLSSLRTRLGHLSACVASWIRLYAAWGGDSGVVAQAAEAHGWRLTRAGAAMRYRRGTDYLIVSFGWRDRVEWARGIVAGRAIDVAPADWGRGVQVGMLLAVPASTGHHTVIIPAVVPFEDAARCGSGA